jgi:hypothetical protein
MTPDDPRPPSPDTPDDPRADAAAAPDPVDELASALVDGDLDPAAADAARARPDVAAREAEMDAARTALRQVPGPDPRARERAVDAALAAFEADAPATTSGAATAPPGPDPVTGLDVRRRRRGMPRWAGAVAAAALVAAGVAGAALWSSDGADDDETASVTGTGDDGAEAGDAAADREEPAAGSPAPESDAETGAESGAPPGADDTRVVGDLGAFPSTDALVDEVGARVGEPYDQGTGGPEVLDEHVADAVMPSAAARDILGDICPDGVPAPLDHPEVTVALRGEARVDGQRLEVWVVDTADGPRVVALGDDCAVVVDEPLA